MCAVVLRDRHVRALSGRCSGRMECPLLGVKRDVASACQISAYEPIRFEPVVNNKAATMLGLKISESFLLNADEVIE